jgi:hypothetical protein
MKNHSQDTPASGQQLPWSAYLRKEKKKVSEPTSPQLGEKKSTITTDLGRKVASKRVLGDINEYEGPEQKKQRSVLSTLSVSETTIVQNKSEIFLKSLKFLKDLDSDLIMRLVQQFYDPTRSLVQASGNQYLTPALRPLKDTDLKFSGQKFSKHCRYVAMRTVDKKGTITETIKLREGGTNNDHPRYLG